MRRILSSFALLAACLGMAACGSSSSNSNPNYLTSLAGNYVFQEQVYTYYGDADASHAPARMTGKTLHKVDVIGRRQQALSVMHKRNQSAAKAQPGQGSVDSAVDWGAAVGSLTFDGQGNVTAGEIDYNEPEGGGYFADSVSGIYSISADNTGSITLLSNNVGAQFFFQIALQGTAAGSGIAATGAQIVEGESDGLGDIEIGTGTMLPQTGTISQSTISGNYVFGMQGQTCYGTPCPQDYQGDLYAAGLLVADGAGTFGSPGQADVSDGFGSGNLALTGTYISPDTFGRATASLITAAQNNTANNDPGALPGGYVLYIASPSTFYIMSTDNNNTANGLSPYLFGTAGLQQSGAFTNASLTGNYVLSETTEDLANENSDTPDTYSDTFLALLTANGSTFNGTGDSNLAGTIVSNVAYNYDTYIVGSNGRVTLSGTTPSGSPAPVFWMQSSGFGYGVDQLAGGTLQEPGLISIYQQSGSSFSASSLNGLYALGTLPASTSNANLLVGTVSSDGSANLSGDVGIASIGGLGSASATGTYTIGSNGRGTSTGSSDSVFGNFVLYVISPTKTIGMDVTSGDSAPSIQSLQQ